MRVGCTRIKCSDPASGHGLDDRARSASVSTWCADPTTNTTHPSRSRIVLVDLEGDLVLSVRDTGPQVLFGEGVGEDVEDDRRPTSCSLYTTGNTVGPKPADVGQPCDPPCADQQQAFGFVQAPGPSDMAHTR
jgi:hypothetical protein